MEVEEPTAFSCQCVNRNWNTFPLTPLVEERFCKSESCCSLKSRWKINSMLFQGSPRRDWRIDLENQKTTRPEKWLQVFSFVFKSSVCYILKIHVFSHTLFNLNSFIWNGKGIKAMWVWRQGLFRKLYIFFSLAFVELQGIHESRRCSSFRFCSYCGFKSFQNKRCCKSMVVTKMWQQKEGSSWWKEGRILSRSLKKEKTYLLNVYVHGSSLLP